METPQFERLRIAARALTDMHDDAVFVCGEDDQPKVEKALQEVRLAVAVTHSSAKSADKYIEAAKLFDKFFDEMPKGQLGHIVCDIGILNDAFITIAEAKKIEKIVNDTVEKA